MPKIDHKLTCVVGRTQAPDLGVLPLIGRLVSGVRRTPQVQVTGYGTRERPTRDYADEKGSNGGPNLCRASDVPLTRGAAEKTAELRRTYLDSGYKDSGYKETTMRFQENRACFVLSEQSQGKGVALASSRQDKSAGIEKSERETDANSTLLLHSDFGLKTTKGAEAPKLRSDVSHSQARRAAYVAAVAILGARPMDYRPIACAQSERPTAPLRKRDNYGIFGRKFFQHLLSSRRRSC
jgi:hypothetical protein